MKRGTGTTDCGNFEYRVKWSIPESHVNDSGWIVQYIRVDFNITDCEGNAIDVKERTKGEIDPSSWPLWEGRGVHEGGNVWVGRASAGVPHQADLFAMDDFGECTKGIIHISGEVKAITGFVPPPDMTINPDSGANDIPSTQTKPPGWTTGTAGRPTRSPHNGTAAPKVE